MWNEESPFYVKPRLDVDLMSWGWKFYRAATPARVERAAPVLRDLNLASLACYRQLASEFGNEFGFAESGILNLCATDEGVAHEAALVERANRLGLRLKSSAHVTSSGSSRMSGSGPSAARTFSRTQSSRRRRSCDA